MLPATQPVLRNPPCSSRSLAGFQDQSCQVARREQTARHRLCTFTLGLLCPAILDVVFEGVGECFVNCCGSQVKNLIADPGNHGISNQTTTNLLLFLALSLILCAFWANYLTSLNLKLPICKIRREIAPTSQSCCKN